MAVNDKKFRYARNSTYGNVAYDLNIVDNTALAAAPAVEYEYPETQEIFVRKVRETAVEESRQGVSLFAVVSFAVLTVLMVLILMAYVQLTAINTQTTELREQLEQLQEDKSRLVLKYENVFDMAEIESYALDVLGMEKIAEDQITVLENIKSDKAVVLSENAAEDGSILHTALAAVLEYFR